MAQGSPDDAELRPFLPILGRLIPDWREHQLATSQADTSIVVLAEAVLRMVRRIASRSGCLLVLEDLHWSDVESLGVVEYLVANITSEPILPLATSRSEVASPALGLARSLSAHRTATMVDLERLPAAAVGEMAAACLDDTLLPEPVQQALSASAEGLPLFVEDLLAEWIGAGTLSRAEADSGWSVHRPPGPIVPVSFAHSVRRRLNFLDPEAVAVVQMAASLGRAFDWMLLPLAAGLDEQRVLEHVDRAKDAQILALLAEGLSNKEIAARLYLSPKTVEMHVASLMDKLEVRSRAQLGALAATKLGTPIDGR